MISTIFSKRAMRAAIADLQTRVNQSVTLGLRQGRYELVEAGYAILNHLQNQMVMLADRVDDFSRERLQDSERLVEQFQQGVNRNIEQIQWIINTLPFAGGNPQIGGVTPRYISFTANRNPNINIVLTISGYFPTIGDRYPVSLSLNNRNFDPSQTSMNQLQFTIPETDFAQPVANAIVQNRGKLIYNRPYMMLFPYQHQFDVVVGTLPISPGNIVLHKPQNNPQQEQIRLNWGENRIVPLPNHGWRVRFTPFHGPAREFNTNDLSHPYISVQVLRHQHQLDIQIKDPRILNLADVQHPVVLRAQAPDLPPRPQNWRDLWMREEPECITLNHEEISLDPIIISNQLCYDNGFVNQTQVVDVTNFNALEGCVRGCLFEASDPNNNLVPINLHAASKKGINEFTDYTFFNGDGIILSYSCNKKTTHRKESYRDNCGRLCHRDTSHSEYIITFRVWDLNLRRELWNTHINDKRYCESLHNVYIICSEHVLSHPNYFMIHLHGSSNSITDTYAKKGRRERLLVLNRIDGSVAREFDMGIGEGGLAKKSGCSTFCHDGHTLYLMTLQGLLQSWDINTWIKSDLEIQTQARDYKSCILLSIASNRVLCRLLSTSFQNSKIQVFDVIHGEMLLDIQANFALNESPIHRDIVIRNQPVGEAIFIKYKNQNRFGILNLDNLQEHPFPWALGEPFRIALKEDLMLIFTTIGNQNYICVIDLNAFELVRQIPFRGHVIDLNIEMGKVVAQFREKDSVKWQVLSFD